MIRRTSRRDFLKQAAVGGSLVAGYGYFSSRAAAESNSPNEKLNIGAIGTANQARFSIDNVEERKPRGALRRRRQLPG